MIVIMTKRRIVITTMRRIVIVTSEQKEGNDDVSNGKEMLAMALATILAVAETVIASA